MSLLQSQALLPQETFGLSLNFWVDIGHFGSLAKALAWGRGGSNGAEPTVAITAPRGLSFSLCNEIVAGENAFFLPFYC